MTKETKQGIVTDPSANEELLALIDRILTGEITTAEIEEILLAYLQYDGNSLTSGGSGSLLGGGLLGGAGSTGGTVDLTTTGAETVSFEQNPPNGYLGCQDTYLQEDSPLVNNGGAGILLVDADSPSNTGQKTQALVKFTSIFGSDPGQVAENATVTEAFLVLETVDPGSGASVHRMLAEWGSADTWSTLVDGVALDDIDAVSAAEATVESPGLGPVVVDVTDAVQAWATGERNEGWVFEPLGDDGWGFNAAEGQVPPKLTVSFDPPATN
jgi:hypothetical protein